jgi:quercetin dioxygenase-like cupin family protein
MSRRCLIALGTALVVSLITPAGWSQVGFRATPLMKTTKTEVGQDIQYPNAHPQVTMLLLEIAPGGQSGRHMHPVPSANYVLEGEVTIEIEGHNTVTYRAGQPFVGAMQTWHNAFNRGTTPAIVLVVFIGEEGKPVTVTQ